VGVEKLLHLVGGVDDCGGEVVHHGQERLLCRPELVVHLFCQSFCEGFLLAHDGLLELGPEITEKDQGKEGQEDDHEGGDRQRQLGFQGEGGSFRHGGVLLGAWGSPGGERSLRDATRGAGKLPPDSTPILQN